MRKPKSPASARQVLLKATVQSAGEIILLLLGSNGLADVHRIVQRLLDAHGHNGGSALVLLLLRLLVLGGRPGFAPPRPL